VGQSCDVPTGGNDTSDAVLYLALVDFVIGTLTEVDGGYAHGG
jgi:hypothetical protein